MPGLVGLITKKPRDWAQPKLLRMLESVCHESFYSTGTRIDVELGVYVGWTALKDSFADVMPLQNEAGTISLIFSGEEYANPESTSRSEMGNNGNRARALAYLVSACESPNFPDGLNGMFHGLVLDRVRGMAMLFNDRYGMHRLYYYEGDDAFYFAVEAKAILAVRPDLRTPSPQGVGEFLACSCVLENRTIFKNIYSLPGGAAWIFRGGAVETKNSYFSPREWEQQEPLEANSFREELRASTLRALPACFGGHQKVGLALTGGLDTRVIMALHQSPPESLPCYTFGGMMHECQDVRLARKVAEVCRQPYHVIEVGNDFLTRFPHYAERSIFLTEGGCDVYRAADLYVSEKAREIAPVKVVGTYGSEILRHAVMFKPMLTGDSLFHPDFIATVKQATQTYAAVRNVHPVTFAAFRQSPWYHHGILALEQTQLTVRSPYLHNDFVRTAFRAPKEAATNGDPRLQLIADGSPALRRIPSDRGVGGNRGAILGAIAHNYLEFTFKAEYAYDYGMPQWVAGIDHLLSPLHLERLFLGRHKFLHFRIWYREQLADYVRQMLLDPLTLSRPYVDAKAVERIVNGHLKGNENHTTAIHKLLTLELLHRKFFDAR
jgi:asparagine synthase (glutamine-hydrolysing)